jgi:hypothetical protein
MKLAAARVPGPSIMPEKVMAEMITHDLFHAQGVTSPFPGRPGLSELNVMMPVIAYNFLLNQNSRQRRRARRQVRAGITAMKPCHRFAGAVRQSPPPSSITSATTAPPNLLSSPRKDVTIRNRRVENPSMPPAETS